MGANQLLRVIYVHDDWFYLGLMKGECRHDRRRPSTGPDCQP
jgi:hypothetical protein